MEIISSRSSPKNKRKGAVQESKKRGAFLILRLCDGFYGIIPAARAMYGPRFSILTFAYFPV